MTPYRMEHSFADLDKFAKYFVGFDKFNDKVNETFDSLSKAAMSTYPPFNIKKTDENVYVIEVAVAGFSKQDIELTFDGGKLVIKGATTVDSLVQDGINTTYLHKGIADRAFTRTFSIADNIEIKNAEMVNGLLKVWLEHIIPENKKPKKIDIKDASEKSTKSFLAE